jgi:signal transduction histidine kinase
MHHCFTHLAAHSLKTLYRWGLLVNKIAWAWCTFFLLLLLIIDPLPMLASSLSPGSQYSQNTDERPVVVFGVFNYLGLETTTDQYAPIAAYLNQVLPEYRTELKVLSMAEMEQSIENGQLDFVTTNPTHFLVIRAKYPLSGVMATLVNIDDLGQPIDRLAGCIFVRADDDRIQNILDIRGKIVAAPSQQHMGGFRAQAFELRNNGVRLPDDVSAFVETGNHQKTIEALINGEVDVALVRSGIYELMVKEGSLNPDDVRLMNPKMYPNFSLLTSTALYPEWPVFALPHVDRETTRRYATALLMIEHDSPYAVAARIFGYTIPGDYLAVEELARTLRVAPFDQAMEVTYRDVWVSMNILIMAGGLVFLITFGLLIALFIAQNKTRRALTNLTLKSEELEDAREIADQLKVQAEQGSRHKSEFLANMSHEIRTPLNGVIGFTDLLSRTRLDYDQRMYVENALQSTRSLMEIINDILDFSKIEANKLELDLVPTDVVLLVEDTSEIAKMLARDKGIGFQINTPANAHPYAHVDPVRLRQILMNLLSNAVKFTTQGQVTVSLSCSPGSRDGYMTYRFSVRDTGIGITEEQKHKLFAAFTQADTSTTRKFGGTGLGLVISARLAEKMNSKIEINSTYGSGTEFWFDLEAKMAREHDLRSKSDQSKPVSLILSETVAPSIILADDNSVNMLLASTLIKKMLPSARILKATNGRQVVDLYISSHPNLILMDIQMPEMDGNEATAAIRQMELQSGSAVRVPIIALTAGGTKEEKERTEQVGMDGFLTKPLEVVHLQDVFTKYLDLKHPV